MVALIGHTIAGGCLRAAVDDYRMMCHARIEVTAALVEGCLCRRRTWEALRYPIGDRTAALVLSGRTVDVG